MRFQRLVAFIACVFLLTVSSVQAQSQFTISVSGGTDTSPPTTPTLLTATPIASSQIDITWSAATDDTIVSGYSILRDGTPIATTTLLSYSDTALTASTTYSYAVRAFDAVRNYSSSSNALATTTLAAPVVPPAATSTSGSQSGTAARVVAKHIVIESGVSTTSVQVETAHPARLEVRWGRTSSYELGYVVSSVFSREHAVLLSDLEPGTEYAYEIIGYTPTGRATLLEQGSFVTSADAAWYHVENVELFSAAAIGTDVTLLWQLPLQQDLLHVRVVRSHLGFPEHPQDGAVVYQGLKESAVDAGVLSKHSPVYYTAFVYDTHGNVSTGAVAVVYAAPSIAPSGDIDTPGTSPKPPVGEPLPEITEATSSIDATRFAVEMKMPTLREVTIRQGSTLFTFADTPIQLDAALSYTVSVPLTAVAGNLKSIIATVHHPTEADTSYSFLLRLNRDRTAYEAQVSPLFVTGATVLVLEIYDYEAFVVGTFQTPVTFTEAIVTAETPVVFPDMLFTWWPLVLLILSIIAVLIGLYIFLKRRAEDND